MLKLSSCNEGTCSRRFRTYGWNHHDPYRTAPFLAGPRGPGLAGRHVLDSGACRRPNPDRNRCGLLLSVRREDRSRGVRYFPIDPNLLAQPRVSAFPNWPNQFPTPGAPVPPPGMTYYPQQGSPYSYGPAQIYPAGYQAPVPAYWYGR
jgi:hypothetical protein